MPARRGFARHLLMVLLNLAAPVQAVQVWLPRAHRVADLTPNGLHLPDGRAVDIPGIPSSGLARPDSSLLALGVRLIIEPLGDDAGFAPHRLWALGLSGQTLGVRTLPAYPAVFPSLLGPCVTSALGNPQPTQCFTPDLRSVRATLAGQLLSVTADGLTAYATPTYGAAEAAPYSPDVPITRYDLGSGQQARLRLRAASPGANKKGLAFGNFVQVMNTHFYLSDWVPVQGGHFLACLRFTSVQGGCQLLTVDRDARVLHRLEDGDVPLLPDIGQGGRVALVLMNSLHVWDTASGKRTLLLRDPRWAAARRQPYAAYFTADSGAVVVITGRPQAGGDSFTAQFGTAQAEVYRLPDGKRLQTFPLRP